MPVSRTQLFELMLPFHTAEHGFTPVSGGNVPYLKKSAIERRLYRVVPGWSMERPIHVITENDVVILSGEIRYDGQVFGALGSGIITRYKKDKDGKEFPVPAYELARNTVLAYKKADSDLLPRCARVMGIGWYLREIPQEWKAKIGTGPGLAEYVAYIRDMMKNWNIDAIPEPPIGKAAAQAEHASGPRMGSGATQNGDNRRVS